MRADGLELGDGSKVAVIGGGPAGSFFSYFLLDMAQRIGTAVEVDIYEPRDFTKPGPAGCNMCGGIVHESLVQILATEGINLPAGVVQRGIDSHMLHMGMGSARIETPLEEKRIGAMYRGAGPRDVKEARWGSLDGHLLSLAGDKGARIIHDRVDEVQRIDGRPQVRTKGGLSTLYDLTVVAVGVNSTLLKVFETLGIDYLPPRTTKTYVGEFYLGADAINEYLGSSVHVFLLAIPGLEFAAFIPKGDYVTMVLIGDGIDNELVRSLLERPELKRCFPPDLNFEQASCHCSPRMTIRGAARPFADRIVFIGDCGVSRFYKDGIGSAYRAAKAAASAAVFQGIGAADFQRHYWPFCERLNRDNMFGRLIFAVVGQIQRMTFTRRAVLRTVTREQKKPAGRKPMSSVMWDMYTGGSPYREILLRTLHPSFWAVFLYDCIVSLIVRD
jgi:flavin-dependent dehydrogenase